MLPDPCLPPRPPVWIAAPGVPPALPRAGASFLVHQARFHVGDTLWLTPLLRAIQRFFPGARTTVVGPPVARELFAGNPHVQEIVCYVPSPGREREERRRVLGLLAGSRFDAALFAFARRPESRWLAKALAAAGVPWRINLEYVDPSLEPAVPAWLTHEEWFVWGTLPSPRMLLHALDPLLGPERVAWTEDDRRVELYVSAEARRRAGELLTERGFGEAPFAILAPGGRSSLRWPARSFARLAARLAAGGLPVLVEGSPGERDLLEAVAAGTGVQAAADPLDVFAALLERACLLVSNDSAPIHLAEAVGTPTVYFAQREKLIHSQPAGDLCRALWAARPSRITVRQALAAVQTILDRISPVR
jgi:ADP-heptose:LPS heptosyltransferase